MSRRRIAAMLALIALGSGCGHSANPVAPYDTSAGVPPPRDVVVQADPVGRLVVRWRATADDRTVVDGWFVERRTSTVSTFTRLTPVAQADTVYFDDEVEEGVRYAYRVLAVTGANVTSAPVETPPVRGDRTGPTAPVNVTAATVSGGVAIGFVDGDEPDLAFFEVRLIRTQASLPPEFRVVAGSPATIAGLVAGAEYAFEVAAIDSAGRISPYSAPPVPAVAGP